MEIARIGGSVALAMASAILQIPSLNSLIDYIPEFMNWGQSASELVKLVYSICGVIMLISSIRMLKVRRELKKFELEMKRKGLQDYEDLKSKLKDAEVRE
jgi:MFS-type transporter involved in bile tolerance (Atg22 family)